MVLIAGEPFMSKLLTESDLDAFNQDLDPAIARSSGRSPSTASIASIKTVALEGFEVPIPHVKQGGNMA
jgi:hypothetical protein